MATQLEGVIQLAPAGDTLVDCSAEIYSARVVEERSTNTKRPTFANAVEGAKAGAPRYMLEIEFEELLDVSTSKAHKAIRDAIRTDSAELDFSLQREPGTGKEIITGTCVVTGVSTGGEVGAELEQSQSFPLTAAGIATSTSA